MKATNEGCTAAADEKRTWFRWGERESEKEEQEEKKNKVWTQEPCNWNTNKHKHITATAAAAAVHKAMRQRCSVFNAQCFCCHKSHDSMFTSYNKSWCDFHFVSLMLFWINGLNEENTCWATYRIKHNIRHDGLTEWTCRQMHGATSYKFNFFSRELLQLNANVLFLISMYQPTFNPPPAHTHARDSTLRANEENDAMDAIYGDATFLVGRMCLSRPWINWSQSAKPLTYSELSGILPYTFTICGLTARKQRMKPTKTFFLGWLQSGGPSASRSGFVECRSA